MPGTGETGAKQRNKLEKDAQRMKTLWKETYQIIKLNFRNLLLFEIIYRIVTGAIYQQLIHRGLKFSLKMAGYSYLTPGNAWKFLLKPWTILVLLVLAVSGLILIMMEIGGLITVYSGAAYSLRVSVPEIFLGAFGKVADEIRRRNFPLFGIGFTNYVLVNLYYFYRMLTHIKPVDFVMKEMLNSPYWRFFLFAAIAVLMALAVPAMFTFHGCMIEQKFYRDSKNRSLKLLKGRAGQMTARQVGVQLGLAAGFIITYAGCVIAAAVCIVVFVEKDLQLAFLMQTVDRLEWVFLLFAGLTAMIVHVGLLTVQYYEFGSFRNQPDRGWDFFYSKSPLVSRKNGLVALTVLGAVGAVSLFDTAYNGNFVTKSMAVQTGITAHRGSSSQAPENTMAAVMAAVEQMADRVEIDVQETADGAVVLCHDSSLKRVAGINKKVSDYTLEELKKLDVGSWFSGEFAGEAIPTLEEVMEYAKGKIDLNIEIKNMGNDSLLPDKVLKLVREHEMIEQCIITSTNRNYLKRLKEMEPEIRTGYIISAAYGNYFSDEFVDIISIRSSFVTERMIDMAHEHGKAVHAWTVNGKVEMERLKQLGVDDIITDRPLMAREILYREEVTEDLLEYLRLILN